MRGQYRIRVSRALQTIFVRNLPFSIKILFLYRISITTSKANYHCVILSLGVLDTFSKSDTLVDIFEESKQHGPTPLLLFSSITLSNVTK